MNPPIEEELKTAFFGVFAIALKPLCMIRHNDKKYCVSLPRSGQHPLLNPSSRTIIGLHNQAEQLQSDHLELEIIPNEIYIQIPYEAIEDYKRISDLP